MFSRVMSATRQGQQALVELGVLGYMGHLRRLAVVVTFQLPNGDPMFCSYIRKEGVGSSECWLCPFWSVLQGVHLVSSWGGTGHPPTKLFKQDALL